MTQDQENEDAFDVIGQEATNEYFTEEVVASYVSAWKQSCSDLDTIDIVDAYTDGLKQGFYAAIMVINDFSPNEED